MELKTYLSNNLVWPVKKDNPWRLYPESDVDYWGVITMKDSDIIQNIVNEIECDMSNFPCLYIAGTSDGVFQKSFELAFEVLDNLPSYIKNIPIDKKDWFIDYLWFPEQSCEDKWYICFGSEYGGDIEFMFTKKDRSYHIIHVT